MYMYFGAIHYFFNYNNMQTNYKLQEILDNDPLGLLKEPLTTKELEYMAKFMPECN